MNLPSTSSKKKKKKKPRATVGAADEDLDVCSLAVVHCIVPQ
jgi:hypothetical protein